MSPLQVPVHLDSFLNVSDRELEFKRGPRSVGIALLYKEQLLGGQEWVMLSKKVRSSGLGLDQV